MLQEQPAVIEKNIAFLLRRFGKQHWWSAHAPFEVELGAILIQNTRLSNV